MKTTLVTINSNVKPEQFASEQCATIVKAAKKLGSKNIPLPKLVVTAQRLGLDTVGLGGLEASVKYHVNVLRRTKRASVKRVTDELLNL